MGSNDDVARARKALEAVIGTVSSGRGSGQRALRRLPPPGRAMVPIVPWNIAKTSIVTMRSMCLPSCDSL